MTKNKMNWIEQITATAAADNNDAPMRLVRPCNRKNRNEYFKNQSWNLIIILFIYFYDTTKSYFNFYNSQSLAQWQRRKRSTQQLFNLIVYFNFYFLFPSVSVPISIFVFFSVKLEFDAHRHRHQHCCCCCYHCCCCYISGGWWRESTYALSCCLFFSLLV